MKNNIKTFKLFVRPDEKSKKIADRIRHLNKHTSNPLIESDNADLIIAIGGDGSFIEAVTNTNFSKNSIYTGIHTGTLGFLQDLCENDVLSLIQYIKFEEELKTRKVYIADVKVHLSSGDTLSYFALNDVIIAGTDYSKISFQQNINTQHSQNITGCGIIIATNTGDTAHSANAGGAIDFTDNCQLISTLFDPIRSAAFERFLPNSFIGTDFNIILTPSNNISIIIDGRPKDIKSEDIRNVEVSISKSNYINKLNLMNYSKVKVVREKLLGYTN